jgi:hypothetical protein
MVDLLTQKWAFPTLIAKIDEFSDYFTAPDPERRNH